MRLWRRRREDLDRLEAQLEVAEKNTKEAARKVKSDWAEVHEAASHLHQANRAMEKQIEMNHLAEIVWKGLGGP